MMVSHEPQQMSARTHARGTRMSPSRGARPRPTGDGESLCRQDPSFGKPPLTRKVAPTPPELQIHTVGTPSPIRTPMANGHNALLRPHLCNWAFWAVLHRKRGSSAILAAAPPRLRPVTRYVVTVARTSPFQKTQREQFNPDTAPLTEANSIRMKRGCQATCLGVVSS